jgi:hypothetical protein
MASRPTRATTKEPTGKPGRPSALTEETTNLFTQALLSLNTLEDAALLAGVDYSTIARWMAKGRKARSGEYREFYEAAEGAKTRAKALLVATVSVAGRKDAKMALKILERRHPKEWAVTRKLELEDKTPPSKRTGIRERLLSQLERIEERLAKPNPLAALAAAGAAAPPSTAPGSEGST